MLLEEETQVGMARRTARELSERIGLSVQAVARAEIVAVELAGNILHHAGKGRMYLASTPDASALQVIAIDDGPGISSVARALEDGFSTSTTPGTGLGAVGRMTVDFDLYTQVGTGTVVSATVGDTQGTREDVAVLSTSIEGETVNGDSWVVTAAGGRQVYTVVDGLGHGVYASEAATMARSIVSKALADEPALGLEALLKRMHGPMRATRGAAIALVSVAGAEVICCGVGNISCALHVPGGVDQMLVSNNGTLGHVMRRVAEFRYRTQPGALLVMHSDGISTKWRLPKYAGLSSRRPATIAGVLYRDAARGGRDDATILVARLAEA